MIVFENGIIRISKNVFYIKDYYWYYLFFSHIRTYLGKIKTTKTLDKATFMVGSFSKTFNFFHFLTDSLLTNMSETMNVKQYVPIISDIKNTFQEELLNLMNIDDYLEISKGPIFCKELHIADYHNKFNSKKTKLIRKKLLNNGKVANKIVYISRLGNRRSFKNERDIQKFLQERGVEIVDFSNLNLKGSQDWREYVGSGGKPDNIPSNPESAYKDEWAGYSYWVGKSNSKIIRKNKYLKFEEAREYARGLKLTSIKEWSEYAKSGKLPNNIPGNPRVMYSDFAGYEDWLGGLKTKTGNFLPFEEAREYARGLKLESTISWKKFLKSGKKPDNIPATPHKVYREEWNGFVDWLGTTGGKFDNRGKKFLPFEEAREYVRNLELKGQKQWNEYAKTDAKPSNIPSGPWAAYKNKWISTADWLGTKRVRGGKARKFSEGRKYARSLGFSSKKEWDEFKVSDKKKITAYLARAAEMTTNFSIYNLTDDFIKSSMVEGHEFDPVADVGCHTESRDGSCSCRIRISTKRHSGGSWK